MSPLAWIVVSGLLMSAIALVGGVLIVLGEDRLRRVLLPLVAFAAGSLLGGALFHMVPAALVVASPAAVFGWVAAGFAAFFGIEQFLHWHHCHRASAACRRPLTYLVLVGDALHNLLGGMSIGALFLADVRLGTAAWLAAALHEIPQELGDFAVLVHGGWSRRAALTLNLLSGLTFLAGGLVVHAVAGGIDVRWLVPLGAGNFLYIGASDLVPEVNKPHTAREAVVHFAAFGAGLAVLGALAWIRGADAH